MLLFEAFAVIHLGDMEARYKELTKYYELTNYIATVSYTHLDVYKRQAYEGFSL